MYSNSGYFETILTSARSIVYMYAVLERSGIGGQEQLFVSLYSSRSDKWTPNTRSSLHDWQSPMARCLFLCFHDKLNINVLKFILLPYCKQVLLTEEGTTLSKSQLIWSEAETYDIFSLLSYFAYCLKRTYCLIPSYLFLSSSQNWQVTTCSKVCCSVFWEGPYFTSLKR